MAAKNLKTPYVDLLPPLSSEEFAALKADIDANGQQDPAIVDHEGDILDGNSRYRILGAKLRTQVLPGCVDMSEAERRAYALRVNLNRRQLSPGQLTALEKDVLSPLANELRWGPDWEKGKGRPVRGVAEVGKLLGRPQRTISEWTAKSTSNGDGAVACSPTRSSQKIAEKDHPKIAARLKGGATQQQVAADMKVSQQRIAQIVKAETKRQTAEAERQKRIKAAAKATRGDDQGVKQGDFRKVAKDLADGSVDLIFTDPPYDRETLPLYGDVAEVAARVLAPGGSLVCYLGQNLTGDVMDLVRPHLRFWWTLAVQHTGQSARMREYGVVVRWKPLLWFVQGTRADKEKFVDDLVVSQQEKAAHPWQQSLVEAEYYLEHLSPPGGLVFDPFCGGGTTAIAARRQGRNWLTCDTDKDAVVLARQRITDAV